MHLDGLMHNVFTIQLLIPTFNSNVLAGIPYLKLMVLVFTTHLICLTPSPATTKIQSAWKVKGKFKINCTKINLSLIVLALKLSKNVLARLSV